MKDGNFFSYRRKVLLSLLSSFIVGAVATAAWFGYFYIPGKSASVIANESTIRLGAQGLVNPLLEYLVPKDTYELAKLEKDISDDIDSFKEKGYAGNISFYFRDLNSGHWGGVNEDDKFSPASLLKIPVMMAFFKSAESDPGLLSETMTYDGSFDDNSIEDIKPIKSIKPGSEYTVDELIKFMIGYSDNNATRLLFERMDQSVFKKVFTDLGMQVPVSQDDFLSPKKLSLFFRVLYNGTYIGVPMSQKALQLLAYNDFPPGISAGVPDNIITAQKFGEHNFQKGGKELHDCGIVYYPQKPYFICVMTKGSDFTTLSNVIREISSKTYSEVDKDYK